MPFKSKGRSSYKTRITLLDGSVIVTGCSTDDIGTARAMEAMIARLRAKHRWDAIGLIESKKAKLSQVFDAHERGELDRFVAEFSTPDLRTLLDEWVAWSVYKRQVRAFVGESRRASTFTRKNVSEFLSTLDVSGSTRNRYRSALSVFASWLVEREVIEHNPVRDVKSSKPNPIRLIWLEREQAQALVNALSNPNRAVEALMAATGVEWQAVERLKRRDVDLKSGTVHAQGSKTVWRNRVVRSTEEWAWRIFSDYARDFTSDALLFEGVNKFVALKRHRRASKKLGLPITTLHDWRHTYAVQSLRDGYRPSVVAHQLGHHNAQLVISRYGRFIPDERDYVLQTAPSRQAAGRED